MEFAATGNPRNSIAQFRDVLVVAGTDQPGLQRMLRGLILIYTFLANFKVDLRMRFFRIWACAAFAFAAKSISQRHTLGIHPSYWPKIRNPIRDSFSLPLNENQLPSLSEIFTTPIFT